MNRNGINKLLVMALALVLAIAFAVPAIAASKKVSVYKGKPAKYVFYFIGDGMGIPQRAAAEKFLGKKLTMDTMPAQGVTTTYAANRYITGSAASATALGAGQKTNIGVIGMTPDLKAVKSVAHIAKEQGKKVGVVSSVSIDHATPAAFYAHVPKRSQYYDIEIQLADSGFDFFGGGGFKDPSNKKKSKNDKGNAFEYAKSKGYKVLNNKDAIMALKPATAKLSPSTATCLTERPCPTFWT